MKALVLDLLERINPVTLKELRQSTQGVAFRLALMLYLLVQALVMTLVMAADGRDGSGEAVFLTLFFVLALMVCVVVPLNASMKFHSDNEGDSMELLSTTTITPFSIIFGKAMAGFANTIVLLLMTMPFLVFSYFLGGVNLVEAGINAILICGFSLLFLTLHILVGVATKISLLRRLMSLGLTVGGVIAMSIVCFSNLGGEMAASQDVVWAVILCLLLFAAPVSVGIFSAVAKIAPEHTNHSRGQRLCLTVATLGLIAFGCIGVLYTGDDEMLEFSAVLGGFLIWMTVLMMLNEPKQYSWRVLQEAGRSWPVRLLNYPFCCGGGNAVSLGVLLSGLLFLSISLTLYALGRGYKFDWGKDWTAMLVICAYMCSYCVIGLGVRHWLLGERWPIVKAQLVVLLIFLVASVAPLVLMVMLSSSKPGVMLVFSPFYLLNDGSGSGWEKALCALMVLFSPAAVIFTLLVFDSLRVFLRVPEALKSPRADAPAAEVLASAAEAEQA